MENKKNDTLASSKRYLNTEELSTYLGRSNWWIYNKVKRREIPFIPMGRGLLFDVRIIDAWIAGKAVDAA